MSRAERVPARHGVSLDEDRIARILREADQRFASYVTADGTLRFDAPAHIVTATLG